MTPLRITWKLATSVIVPDAPIHLDSLLSWARVDEATQTGEARPLDLQHDLPLERFTTPSGWCFKASWIDFKWAGEPRLFHYARRSDPTEFAEAFDDGLLRNKPGWSGASGSTKGYSLVLQERLASHATAYAIGDEDGIRELLKRVPSVGKLRRMSKGLIMHVEVEEIERSACHWGMRNLPMDAEEQDERCATAAGCLRAPYWKDRHGFVKMPVEVNF